VDRDQPRGGPRPTLVAACAVAVAVVVGVFVFALPELAGYGAVLGVLAGLTPVAITLLALLALVNVVTYAPPLQATLPGLGFRRALSSTMISAALANVAPAGDALGLAAQVALYRRWGHALPAITIALAVAGAANGLFIVLLPPAGLAALAVGGGLPEGLAVAAIVALVLVVGGLAAVVWALRSHAAAERLGRGAHRLAEPLLRRAGRPTAGDWGPRMAALRDQALVLLRTRWGWIAIATAISNLAVVACVIAALRACGVGPDQVSWLEALVAWSVTRTLLFLPITPGGVGIIEIGMSGALIALGAPPAAAVAAVLLERAMTYIPPTAIGLALAALHGAAGLHRPALARVHRLPGPAAAPDAPRRAA
jgi:uncharacterized membrane protein YbhN (UPF0104 family)